MKVLEAGTRRFLLVNDEEVKRNFQRRGASGAVALVAEADPDRPGVFITHTGFGVLADGPVALAYEPTGKVAVYSPGYRLSRKDVRAAFVTYGRVAIAEDNEEAQSLLLAETTADTTAETTKETSATTATTTRPSAKKATVKKPEENSQ